MSNNYIKISVSLFYSYLLHHFRTKIIFFKIKKFDSMISFCNKYYASIYLCVNFQNTIFLFNNFSLIDYFWAIKMLLIWWYLFTINDYREFETLFIENVKTASLSFLIVIFMCEYKNTSCLYQKCLLHCKSWYSPCI